MKGCKAFFALLLALLLPLTALAESPATLAPELATLAVDTARLLGVEPPAELAFHPILPADDAAEGTESASWFAVYTDEATGATLDLTVFFDQQNRVTAVCLALPSAADAAKAPHTASLDSLLADTGYTVNDVFFFSGAMVDAGSPDGDLRCFVGLRGDGSRPWDNALLTFFLVPDSDFLHTVNINYVQ